MPISLEARFVPVTLGLVLAIPIAAFTADARIASGLRHARLLTPDEREVVRSANALSRDWVEEAGRRCRRASRRRCRVARCASRDASTAAPPRRRARGEVDVQLATARAKLETFETLDDAALLTPKEKIAVLADATTLDRLLALPRARSIARPI